jgi:hypothetical protein
LAAIKKQKSAFGWLQKNEQSVESSSRKPINPTKCLGLEGLNLFDLPGK